MSAPTELSLVAAKSKFFAVNAEQRKLQAQHRLLLRASIDECIVNGKREALYEVPKTLSGAYPDYDVHEVGLRLMKQARAGNFDVCLITTDPFVFRVSGWDDTNWMEEHRPKKAKKRVGTGGSISIMPKPKPAQKKYSSSTTAPKKKITPEDASVMAQTGQLSRSLKAALAKSRGNGAF